MPYRFVLIAVPKPVEESGVRIAPRPGKPRPAPHDASAVQEYNP
jgi:hypothetical protein